VNKSTESREHNYHAQRSQIKKPTTTCPQRLDPNTQPDLNTVSSPSQEWTLPSPDLHRPTYTLKLRQKTMQQPTSGEQNRAKGLRGKVTINPKGYEFHSHRKRKEGAEGKRGRPESRCGELKRPRSPGRNSTVISPHTARGGGVTHAGGRSISATATGACVRIPQARRQHLPKSVESRA
jgi:hypothetical protein